MGFFVWVFLGGIVFVFSARNVIQKLLQESISSFSLQKRESGSRKTCRKKLGNAKKDVKISHRLFLLILLFKSTACVVTKRCIKGLPIGFMTSEND